jgi:hypothetical protein
LAPVVPRAGRVITRATGNDRGPREESLHLVWPLLLAVDGLISLLEQLNPHSDHTIVRTYSVRNSPADVVKPVI